MSICSISDCNKQVFSGGWCCGHYERWKKYGNPQFIPDSRRKKPLEGKTFGRWTVISLASNEKVDHRVMYRWLCKCQCGEEREIAEQGLLNGRTASCGCSRQDVLAIDLTGQRFGRWVVLRRVKLKLRASKRGSKWECRCDCGTERVVSANALKHSGSTSCGCAQREYAAALAPRTRSVGKKTVRIRLARWERGKELYAVEQCVSVTKLSPRECLVEFESLLEGNTAESEATNA
jgi:hypothetical protein